MIKMKALHSFGVQGQDEGWVSRGNEFEAATDQRARDLEEAGLAARVDSTSQKLASAVPAENKAAAEGPLGSRGGKTGEGRSRSSSARGRQPRKSTSGRSKAKRAS